MVFHKSGPRSFSLESFALGAEAVFAGASTTAKQVPSRIHNRLAKEQLRCTTHKQARGIALACAYRLNNA